MVMPTSHLKFYSQKDTVICVESINNYIENVHSPLHFVFVGDSRARQLFYNFLKVYNMITWTFQNLKLNSIFCQFIPDYDGNFEPKWTNDTTREIIWKYNAADHIDMSFESHLFGLKISFFWRPKLNEQWMDLIQHWINTNLPYSVVISILNNKNNLPYLISISTLFFFMCCW